MPLFKLERREDRICLVGLIPLLLARYPEVAVAVPVAIDSLSFVLALGELFPLLFLGQNLFPLSISLSPGRGERGWSAS
jgi:hypothetical protein